MDRRLRYGLIGAAGLGVLVLALPFVVPAGVYKDQIEQRVSAATGRKFTIAGPVRFTIFPMLGVRAERVSLANPPGASKPAMATADGLQVGVRLLPLLSGRAEVSEIVLDRPDIDLEVDAKGRANWTFARDRPAPPRTGKAQSSINAHFSGLRIAHGHLRYSNARSGSAHALGDIEATIGITEIGKPVTASGSFAYAGRRLDFTLEAATPRTLIDDETASLDLQVKSDLMRAAFTGTIAPNGRAMGRVRVDASSIRAAGAWLGAKIPNGLEAFSLTGTIDGDNRLAQFSELKIKLDGAAIAGNLTIDTRGEVPGIKGALSIDHLDLNRYIASAPGAAPKLPARRPPENKDAWSRDPVSLAALREFDAQLAIDAGRLSVKKLQLGKTRIAVSLDGGDLRAVLGPMALYGGSGKAYLNIDTRAAVPQFRNAASFDDVALRPFLSDTIGVTQIEGTGTIKLDAVARGSNADAVMHALNGKGSIAFRNGRLRGVDFGAVARTIQFVLAGAGKSAFTDYASMDGSFAIANGVLTTKDFQLAGPLLKVTGAGDVDAGGRTIDFKIVPKATASLAKVNFLSLGVPFRIKGPWAHVHYTPDLAGAIGTILENLNVGNAPFKGLLGGTSKPDAPKKKHKTTEEALKNMLGIH